jgi:hypothetical protein
MSTIKRHHDFVFPGRSAARNSAFTRVDALLLVRCRPGIVTSSVPLARDCEGPGSAVHRFTLHRIRETSRCHGQACPGHPIKRQGRARLSEMPATSAGMTIPDASWPGLSRPSRSHWYSGACLSEMPATSAGMTGLRCSYLTFRHPEALGAKRRASKDAAEAPGKIGVCRFCRRSTTKSATADSVAVALRGDPRSSRGSHLRVTDVSSVMAGIVVRATGRVTNNTAIALSRALFT